MGRRALYSPGLGFASIRAGRGGIFSVSHSARPWRLNGCGWGYSRLVAPDASFAAKGGTCGARSACQTTGSTGPVKQEQASEATQTDLRQPGPRRAIGRPASLSRDAGAYRIAGCGERGARRRGSFDRLAAIIVILAVAIFSVISASNDDADEPVSP